MAPGAASVSSSRFARKDAKKANRKRLPLRLGVRQNCEVLRSA